MLCFSSLVWWKHAHSSMPPRLHSGLPGNMAHRDYSGPPPPPPKMAPPGSMAIWSSVPVRVAIMGPSGVTELALQAASRDNPTAAYVEIPSAPAVYNHYQQLPWPQPGSGMRQAALEDPWQPAPPAALVGDPWQRQPAPLAGPPLSAVAPWQQPPLAGPPAAPWPGHAGCAAADNGLPAAGFCAAQHGGVGYGGGSAAAASGRAAPAPAAAPAPPRIQLSVKPPPPPPAAQRAPAEPRPAVKPPPPGYEVGADAVAVVKLQWKPPPPVPLAPVTVPADAKALPAAPPNPSDVPWAFCLRSTTDDDVRQAPTHRPQRFGDDDDVPQVATPSHEETIPAGSAPSAAVWLAGGTPFLRPAPPPAIPEAFQIGPAKHKFWYYELLGWPLRHGGRVYKCTRDLEDDTGAGMFRMYLFRSDELPGHHYIAGSGLKDFVGPVAGLEEIMTPCFQMLHAEADPATPGDHDWLEFTRRGWSRTPKVFRTEPLPNTVFFQPTADPGGILPYQDASDEEGSEEGDSDYDEESVFREPHEEGDGDAREAAAP